MSQAANWLSGIAGMLLVMAAATAGRSSAYPVFLQQSFALAAKEHAWKKLVAGISRRSTRASRARRTAADFMAAAAACRSTWP
jgi:hypothetical protein